MLSRLSGSSAGARQAKKPLTSFGGSAGEETLHLSAARRAKKSLSAPLELLAE